ASNGGNAAIQIKLTPTCALPAPNPFLLQPGITQMKFLGTGVPFARICIFTLNGDRVAELNEQSGSSELSWDGRNSAGDYVTTGIYFYTAENAEEKNNRGQFTVIRR
ncbi:MAG TPA: hypothetical protein VJC03_01520, partial [bacterium]|nr:hypothetical protein [bacterium]